MLEDVVENHVVERQNVLHLDVPQPVLGRRQVGESVGHQDAAVVALNAVEKPVNTEADCTLDRCLIYGVVRRPPSNLHGSTVQSQLTAGQWVKRVSGSNGSLVRACYPLIRQP